MSWKLTGNPKTQRVTTKLAEQFAKMEAAPSDRPLSEIRLRVYEKIIRAGGFRPCSWAVAYCAQTGQQYRVNGKHTSTLMAGLPLDELPELFAIVEYYECDTLEDVARLYGTYDSKMNSRTTADINKSFASCVPQLEGIFQRTLNLCASAVWYADRLEQYKSMQPQERAEGLLENYDFVVWVQSILGSSGSKNHHMKRLAIVAAMFSTYRKSKRAAEEFWCAVRDETGGSPSDPDRKLAKYLLLHVSQGANNLYGGQSKRYRISDREFFVKCLHAWNAWRAHEPTDLRYYANKGVPDMK